MASEKHSKNHNAPLDRKIASDLWRHTLSQISSVTGRMFFLASLRNLNSGQYEHHGLAQMFGSLEASRALKKSHREAFSEWISYDVEAKMADLELYLSEQPEDRRTILKTWEKLEPYRNILPSSPKDLEKKIYFANLRAILNVLRNASGAADPDPES
jgi:hypothetical protein